MDIIAACWKAWRCEFRAALFCCPRKSQIRWIRFALINNYFVAVNTGGNCRLNRIRFGLIPVQVESIKLILIGASTVFRSIKADGRILCIVVRRSGNRSYFFRRGDILRRMIVKGGVGGYLSEIIQCVCQDFLFVVGCRAVTVSGLNHRHIVFGCQIKIVCSAVFFPVIIPSCSFPRIVVQISQILHPYIARCKLIGGMGSGHCQLRTNTAEIIWIICQHSLFYDC